MHYDVTDLAEIAYHHLVLSQPDPAKSDRDVRGLISRLEAFVGQPVVEQSGWAVCEGCGCWVGSELIGRDGAGEADDGGFYCAECRFAQMPTASS